MFAQLGDIIFENMMSPVSYGQGSSASYAEHEMINGKNRLQFTGDNLNEVRMDIRLHVSFCRPKQTLDILKGHKSNGDVIKLIWGNGDVEGDFVILSLDESIEDADNNGNVFSYTVSVELKEYFIADKHDEKRRSAMASAPAVIKDTSFKMPDITATPIALPGDNKALATAATDMNSKSKIIESILTTKNGIMNSRELETIKAASNKVISTAQDALHKASEPLNVLNRITGGTNIVSDIMNKATNVLTSIGVNTANTLDFSKQLSEATQRLQKAASGVINDVIKRAA